VVPSSADRLISRSIRADTKPEELLVSRSPSAVPGAGVERDWHTLADDYRRRSVWSGRTSTSTMSIARCSTNFSATAALLTFRARIGADSIPNTKIDIVAAGFAELGGHLQL
jgi:hypothetical protein